MSKYLHFDQAAEREANEIAFRFMDSSDVVGDMSRAYGAGLSSVRIHTDENAAQKVEGTGADAFSTGKDVFFGRGVFDRNAPVSRGLLAHELAHSLQQGAGGGVNVGSIGQNLEEMGPLPSEKAVQYSEPLGQMSSDLLQMVGSYAASDAGRDCVRTIVDPIKRFKAFGDDPTGAANTQNERNFVMEKLIGIARAEAESGMQRAYAPDKRGAARSKVKGVDYRSANASVDSAFRLLQRMPELMDMPEEERGDPARAGGEAAGAIPAASWKPGLRPD